MILQSHVALLTLQGLGGATNRRISLIHAFLASRQNYLLQGRLEDSINRMRGLKSMSWQNETQARRGFDEIARRHTQSFALSRLALHAFVRCMESLRHLPKWQSSMQEDFIIYSNILAVMMNRARHQVVGEEDAFDCKRSKAVLAFMTRSESHPNGLDMAKIGTVGGNSKDVSDLLHEMAGMTDHLDDPQKRSDCMVQSLSTNGKEYLFVCAVDKMKGGVEGDAIMESWKPPSQLPPCIIYEDGKDQEQQTIARLSQTEVRSMSALHETEIQMLAAMLWGRSNPVELIELARRYDAMLD